MAHNRGKLSEVNTSKYAREKSFDITFNQKEYNNYINWQTTKYGALANMNVRYYFIILIWIKFTLRLRMYLFYVV